MAIQFGTILPLFAILLCMLSVAVEGKRIYMSWQTVSLPMTMVAKCGVFQDNQGFGSKGCPEVDLVGNWAKMDLNKEKCVTACGWSACMKGPTCKIKNAFGAEIYSVSCTPQGSSTPGPNGMGFITTNECAGEKKISG